MGPRPAAPSSAGQGLRAAAVLLTAGRFVGCNENQQLLSLLAQLAALTDVVTRLRENQDRAAQAAAARRAAEQLRLTRRAARHHRTRRAGGHRDPQPSTRCLLRPRFGGPGPVQGSTDSRRGPRR